MELEGLSEEVADEQKLNGWEGASSMKIWGKVHSRLGEMATCKGPEVGGE